MDGPLVLHLTLAACSENGKWLYGLWPYTARLRFAAVRFAPLPRHFKATVGVHAYKGLDVSRDPK